MFRSASILAATLIAASPATADGFFYFKEGSWTIWSDADGCRAANRPTIEMNVSPFAAAVFSRSNDGNITLTAHYWPGTFEEGQETSLTVLKRGEKEITMKATALNDYAAKADRPFTREEVSLLGDEQVLSIRSPAARYSIGVETGGFDRLRLQLGFCMQSAGPSETSK